MILFLIRLSAVCASSAFLLSSLSLCLPITLFDFTKKGRTAGAGEVSVESAPSNASSTTLYNININKLQ